MQPLTNSLTQYFPWACVHYSAVQETTWWHGTKTLLPYHKSPKSNARSLFHVIRCKVPMKVSSGGNASAGHSESTGFKYGRRTGYLDRKFCLHQLFRKTPVCISNVPSLPIIPPSLETNNRRSVKSHVIQNIFHQVASSTQSSDNL